MFGEVFRLVVQEKFAGLPQVGEPSYYPRKVPSGGVIDPTWPRTQIDRFIRAMYFPPFKGAVVRLQDGSDKEVLSMQEYDAAATKAT